MKTYEFLVGERHSGERLDVFLVSAGLELSRRKIRQVIDVGGVYVNRKRVRIASRQVVRGDAIRFEYSDTALTQLKKQQLAFKATDLLYEAHQIYAVNKPPGMPSQATKDQSIMHVVPCLEQLLKEQHKPKRQLILVHRLDKETSGVLLVAAGAKTGTWLTDQFRERRIAKTYLALCHGVAKEEEFAETAFLSPIDKRTGDVRVVRAGGKQALTRFRTLAVDKALGLSLIECAPLTGRSHQIRVHLQCRDLPIVGDKRYAAAGRKALPAVLADLASVHHLLHARRLSFCPGEGLAEVSVEAPLPERFSDLLGRLGWLRFV